MLATSLSLHASFAASFCSALLLYYFCLRVCWDGEKSRGEKGDGDQFVGMEIKEGRKKLTWN